MFPAIRRLFRLPSARPAGDLAGIAGFEGHLPGRYDARVMASLAHESAATLRNGKGMTVLHLAAYARCHEFTVAEIIARGADGMALDNDGRSVLHWAVMGGQPVPPALVARLCRVVGVLIDARDHCQARTALMVAAGYGHLEAVTMMLICGASIGLLADDGMTALMVAAQNGHQEVAVMLQLYHLLGGTEPNEVEREAVRSRDWKLLALSDFTTEQIAMLMSEDLFNRRGGASLPVQ